MKDRMGEVLEKIQKLSRGLICVRALEVLADEAVALHESKTKFGPSPLIPVIPLLKAMKVERRPESCGCGNLRYTCRGCGFRSCWNCLEGNAGEACPPSEVYGSLAHAFEERA